MTVKMSCPKCGYDEDKLVQLNSENHNDWICSNCYRAWQVTLRREC